MGKYNYKPQCKLCGDEFEVNRWKLGIVVCMPCGDGLAVEKARSYTVAPMHKSNYVLITDKADLVGLNNKGGLVK
jgi:ribosomal protein L37AE/L43A